MAFTTALDQLIQKYIKDPSSVKIGDLLPLVDFIESQRLKLDQQVIASVHKEGEVTPPAEIPATYVVRGRAPHKKDASLPTAIITIGVHGNEIYAGAIAVLEVLKAQKKGELLGDVIVQLGNRPAIKGFMESYHPDEDYTLRAGWRCTYGTQLTGKDVKDPDGQTVTVMDDLNRVNRKVMQLPRGEHPNIDRAQELFWTVRAADQGLWPNEQNVFSQSDKSIDISFILHPHTSRSPNGIKNFSFPSETVEDLKQGRFGKPFIYTPPYMMNLVRWLGKGLGGAENVTLMSQMVKDMSKPTLFVTAELGNHEDYRTNDAASLVHTTRIFTAGLMARRTMVNESKLKAAYNLAVNNHVFNQFEARDGGFTFDDLSDLNTIADGDMLYPVRPIKDDDRLSLDGLSIADCVILCDQNGKAEILSCDEARENTAKIQNAYQAYYQSWPQELEKIHQGEPVFLALDKEHNIREIRADFDFYAIFPWIMRQSFPLKYDAEEHKGYKLFFLSETKSDLPLPQLK